MYQLKLNESRQIVFCTSQPDAAAEILVDDIPDGVLDYQYIDGTFVYHPIPRTNINYAKQERLAELHSQLEATDYIDNKIVETLISSGMDAARAVAGEYADVIAQRQRWRDEINELEIQGE